MHTLPSTDAPRTSRIRAWWIRSGQTDYFEKLRTSERRHFWPLLVWGICAAIIFGARYHDAGWHEYGPFSPQYLKSLITALPVSLVVDVAIICVWWAVVRVRNRFATSAPRSTSIAHRQP